MAALLARSFSQLCIHAQKVPRLLASYKTGQYDSVQPYSAFRNLTVLNRKHVLPEAKISSSLVNRSLFHTTTVCATTQERKEWREHRVLDRFYRLHWGGWIRTFGGRQKQLYKKSLRHRKKLKEHVFCNGTQSRKLDRLVTMTWRKPKYYVESPYEQYHKRTNCIYFPNERQFYP